MLRERQDGEAVLSCCLVWPYNTTSGRCQCYSCACLPAYLWPQHERESSTCKLAAGDIVDLLHLTFGKRLVLSGNKIYGTLPPMSSYVPGYVSPPLAQIVSLMAAVHA